MGGGFFHRNEKFQKTKVIYFMLGTSSLMGGSKIQILHFIIIPYNHKYFFWFCNLGKVPQNLEQYDLLFHTRACQKISWGSEFRYEWKVDKTLLGFI